MKITVCCFAAQRYWTEQTLLDSAFREIKEHLSGISEDIRLIQDGNRIPEKSNGILVAVPLSGAVQPDIIDTAKNFSAVCLYAAYVKGNLSDSAREQLLKNNAAPTVMDCWAVLKRTHERCLFAENLSVLSKNVTVLNAACEIQQEKLLLIGETEPWVISAERDLTVYQNKLGIHIEKICSDELESEYRKTTDLDAENFFRYYKDSAVGCVEPDDNDIRNAARLAAALISTVRNHHANGVAIACFSLIRKLQINPCMGVGFINDCTDLIAACEGDTDSAVTMLLMRHIAKDKLWMANPGIEPDGSVRFSHCTAPLTIGGKLRPTVLRNHHESGLGVSPEVSLPENIEVTLCRISDGASYMTVQKGNAMYGEHEPVCRTQLTVMPEDPKHYIDTALGCHQVIAFEDISEEMKSLGSLLGLTVL